MIDIEVENYGNRAVVRSAKFTVGVNKKGVKVIESYGIYVKLDVLNLELIVSFKAESLTENDVALFSSEINQVKEIIKEIEKLKLRD